MYPCIVILWLLHETSGPLVHLKTRSSFRSTKHCLQFAETIRGRGNGGGGGSIYNIVQWTWIFCFGPRYVDALSPQFNVPVVILSPPVRIHTYEQPVISAETVYCLTFARALFYVLTGNRRIAGFIKWFVMRMSLLTSQRYVGGIFC